MDTVQLARYLLGKLVIRQTARALLIGRIVETEAYPVGDAAGHAYRGMTPRNRSLFLSRGHAYVYLAYGVSYMLNVSSEALGVGAGVLIRAVEPLDGIDLFRKGPLWLGRDGYPGPKIGVSKRIGLSREADRLLRFYARGNRYVSGPRRVCSHTEHGSLSLMLAFFVK